MPQNIGKHENKPYSISPDKVKIVKRFLDTNFKKGNYDDIGPDGMPRRTRIVAMIAPTGDVLKNMYQEDLLDLLIEKFKNMFLDHTERELFLKQVMKDWFDDKIGVFGNLSVNRLLRENSENETRGVIDEGMDKIIDYIIAKVKENAENGMFKFIIMVPESIIKQSYPYENCPEKITVMAKTIGDGGPVKGEYSLESGELIYIQSNYIKQLAEKNCIDILKETLSHELTHLINDREGTIQPIYFPEDLDEKVKDMLYCFRPTEMSARVSEFSKVLRKIPVAKIGPAIMDRNLPVKHIAAFEESTSLQYMEQLLQQCREDEKFRKKVMEVGRENGLGKMTSLSQYEHLFNIYKKKIYRVFFDWQEYVRGEYMKMVIKQYRQQPSPALNEITSEEVTIEANEANTNPTEGQKEAGNYKMGHISVKGMKIAIENPKGSKRYYGETDENGNRKFNVMKNHYGYFNVTKGKDGDAVDCFLGPNIEGFDKVYAVDQNTKEGDFDETKVMLGFNSKEEAKEAYLSNYEPGWNGLRAITGVSLKTFKKWLYRGRKQRQPFADYVYIQKKKIDEQKKKNPTV